jgi:dihydrolipoamide dehydrogenase
MPIECDIAVVGGGPGGYVAAIRATQLGARAVLIEKGDLGGTCTNVGCIPSKALLESAERMISLGEMAEFGIDVAGFTSSWDRVQARREQIVKRSRSAVESLVKSNGITLVRGLATFAAPNRLQVAKAEGGTEEVTAKSVVIATGSTEARPPVEGIDLPGVMTSKEALSIQRVPKSIVIVGGGYIGVEFATIFRAFGSEVTVVEMLPTLIPLEDPDLGKALAASYQKRGIGVKVGTRVGRIAPAEGGFEVTLVSEAGEEKVQTEHVLVAVGRYPYAEGLGLDRIGVALDRRTIKVDDHLRTSVAGVYAIGDVVGKYPLAHVASAQGEVAVENALGHEVEMSYRAVPDVIFCHPQIAATGLTEAKAKEAGFDVQVGRYPFTAVPKAAAAGHTEGFVKVVSERRYGQVLGFQMIGAGVTDLIAEAVLAINLETTVEDFAATIHGHPTLPEGLREAVLASAGRAIHILNRRR